MTFAPIPCYPTGFDSNRTLYLVFNTAETQTSADNAVWAAEIDIEPVGANDPEQWATNGYANIAGELFYYDSVGLDENGKINKLKNCARNRGGSTTQFNPAGTWVRGYVIAEHHNQLVTAIELIEHFIGLPCLSECQDDTISCKLFDLQKETSCLDDSGCPNVNFSFTPQTPSTCDGTIADYNVQIVGNYTSFNLDFGDGTSTSTTLSGQHTYAPNSTMDPVVTVSSANCQIVQTPASRAESAEPAPSTTGPIFEFPIPTLPSFPPITTPSFTVPEPTLTFPPIIPPCGSGGGSISIGTLNIPSVITFENLPNFPSIVNFGPAPTFPTLINFGPVPGIPTLINFGPAPNFGPIFFGPAPTFGPISFGPTPSIPTLISFINAPRLPSNISITGNVSLPSRISVVGGISVPSSISVTGQISVPSNISLTGKLSISTVSFAKAPSFSKISFANPPSFSKISFANPPSFSKVSFASPPSFTKVSFAKPPSMSLVSFAKPPSMSLVSFTRPPKISDVSWSSPPSIPNVKFDAPPEVRGSISVSPIRFGPVPTIPPIQINPGYVTVIWGVPPTVYCEVTVNCPTTTSSFTAWEFEEAAQTETFHDNLTPTPAPSKMEVELNDIGIPSEIQMIAPKIPDVKLVHELPQSISLEVPEIPDIKITGAEHIPSEIRLVADGIPEMFKLTSDIPSVIKLDTSALPNIIQLAVPTNFPKTITLDASQIPEYIQVRGIPDTISVIADIPKKIMLEVEENSRQLDLVYRGPPIPVQFDIKNLLGENKDNLPCFALVPCNK